MIPHGPTCYFLAPGTPTHVLNPVAPDVVDRPDMIIPANPPWHFYCKSAPTEHVVPLAQWENGISLLGTEVTGHIQPGGHLSITHTWSYRGTELTPSHFFNHLLLDGELIAQVDGGGVSYWYWRDGDILLTYFTLLLPAELPDGDYVLRTGLYTWPGIVRILRVTGEDGYLAYEVTVPSP